MAESLALADCAFARPHPGVEITRAGPQRRSFPARASEMLGVCLKLGGAHEVESDGRRLVYPADAACVRPPGCVWASRTPPVGFVSIDLAPELQPGRSRGREVRGLRLLPRPASR